jgi:hypothetical protein
MHTGRFSHLRVCLEPDWEAFGWSEDTTAMADFIQLAERLGCRDEPRTLQRSEAVCLARGADAAACLCAGLMQAVGDPRRRWLPTDTRARVEGFLSLLPPASLLGMAEELRGGVPGAPQRAYAASQQLHAALETRDIRERDKQVRS